jgi:hypothetical protein
MSTSIKGVIQEVSGDYLVSIDKKYAPKGCNQRNYKLLNIPQQVICPGDEVECELIRTNRSENIYKVYILNKVRDSINLEEFIRLVNIAVVNRINKEELMFGKLFDKIEYENLCIPSRKRLHVAARAIAVNQILKLVGAQIDISTIGSYYGITRASVYHYIKIHSEFLMYRNIKKIDEDVNLELNTIYNQLLQPKSKDNAKLPYKVEIL